MKKVIYIVLAALVISVFFVIGALADDVSLTGTTYDSTNTSLITSLSSITALPEASFPISTDGAFYYTVFRVPNYETISEVQFQINISSLAGRQVLYLTENSGDTLTVYGQISDSFSEGVNTLTADLSNVQDKITYIVFVWTKASGSTAQYLNSAVDITVPNVWDGVGGFITGIFGAIGSILSGVLNQSVILAFVIVIPLAGIVRDLLLYKMLMKKNNNKKRYYKKKNTGGN